jgi:hypothetical protein
VHLKLNDQAQRTVLCKDPFRSHDERVRAGSIDRACEVSGEPGQQPTITIGDSPTPQTSSSIVVAEGTGDPVDTSGQIVVQAQGASFTSGETVYSTWDASPEPVPAAGLPGLAEALEGAGAGTRVLVLLSAADSGGEPLALVLDVLGSV